MSHVGPLVKYVVDETIEALSIRPRWKGLIENKIHYINVRRLLDGELSPKIVQHVRRIKTYEWLPPNGPIFSQWDPSNCVLATLKHNDTMLVNRLNSCKPEMKPMRCDSRPF